MKAFAKLGVAILMGGAAALASAQDHQHAARGADGAHETAATSAAAALTEGEVRKIDKEAGKITLRHGEIKNLNMAAMTMVLRVQDPAMLDQVQVGDKLRFAAERVNGAVTIVQMQKAE
ncbi:copper-binding protein [Massilia sp.]|uniref:copper-binding protein n=1 Tax=Massilia sp. TaxID=1882437 RepID=UPI00391CF8C8